MPEIVGEEEAMAKYIGCPGRGGRVKYFLKDVKDYVSSYYDGSSDTNYYVECPRCEHDITVRGRY